MLVIVRFVSLFRSRVFLKGLFVVVMGGVVVFLFLVVAFLGIDILAMGGISEVVRELFSLIGGGTFMMLGLGGGGGILFFFSRFVSMVCSVDFGGFVVKENNWY